MGLQKDQPDSCQGRTPFFDISFGIEVSFQEQAPLDAQLMTSLKGFGSFVAFDATLRGP
jgi:hypothetical protein